MRCPKCEGIVEPETGYCYGCKCIMAPSQYQTCEIKNSKLVLREEPKTTPDIDQTLAERGKAYGPFTGHALITQRLKLDMHLCGKWEALAPDQKECLEMIAHKIGRILNGDPNLHDSWHDICGYSKLVADRLIGKIV